MTDTQLIFAGTAVIAGIVIAFFVYKFLCLMADSTDEFDKLFDDEDHLGI